MSESRFGKYLIYALGEIALVMIGILLALQVNNWNEGQKRNVEEIKILKELVANLRADSVDHIANKEWYDKSAKASEIMIGVLESKSPWHDSLGLHCGWLFLQGLANLNTSAYDNLKSQGFGLIRNDEIRLGLTNLYSDEYDRMLKYEAFLSQDNYNQVISPVLLTRLKMDRWFHAEPLNYTALMEDEEFREVIRWKGIYMSFMSRHCQSACDGATKLIALIEEELKLLEG